MARVPKQLREAAQGMEAMFLDYLMKTMRESVPKNEMSLDNPAVQLYQGLQDSETAKTAARAGGVGLAEQMVAYMMAQSYTGSQGQGAPMRVQGGTHEGHSVR